MTLKAPTVAYTASRGFLSELGAAYVSIEENIIKHGRAGMFAPITQKASKADDKVSLLGNSAPPAYSAIPAMFNPKSKIARSLAVGADVVLTPLAAVSYLPMYGAYKLARAAGASKDGANKAAGVAAFATIAGIVGMEAKIITDENKRK